MLYFRVLFLSIFLSLVSDIPKTSGNFYFLGTALLVIYIISCFIFTRKMTVINFLILILAGRDIWIEGGKEVVSIWQQQLSIINPSLLVVLLCFLVFWRLKITIIKNYLLFILLTFLIVPIFFGLYSGALLGESVLLEVIVDLKFSLMLIIGIILVNNILDNKILELSDLLKIIFIIFCGRHLVDFFYYIIGYGPYFSGIANRVSLDSLKGAVILIAYYSIFKIYEKGRNIFYFIPLLLSSLLLFVYSTRMLWVTFLIGLILLFFIIGGRKRIKFIVTLPILITLFFIIMRMPIFELQYTRLMTVVEGRSSEDMVVNVDYNFLSRIDPVRYAQYINVFYSIKSDISLFFGKGIGGYYENYPLVVPNTLEAAYPAYSYESGKYYKTHDMASHIILKFGVIGLLVYIYLYFLCFKGWFNIVKIYNNSLVKAYFCLLPTVMLQFYWSGKNLIFAGIFLGIGIMGLKLFKDEKSNC